MPRRKHSERAYVESRICEHCDRVYLWPPYGGQRYCTDCMMTHGQRKVGSA